MTINMTMKYLAGALSVSVLLCAFQVHSAESGAAQSLAQLAVGKHRSKENIARNAYRHPVETLAFFSIKPDMTVVEVWPGGGWYTEILAPYLREKGRYIAAGFDPESDVEYFAKNAKTMVESLQSKRDLYGDVTVTVMAPPEKLDIAPPGTADAVLTFRNVHNWMRNAGGAEKAFQAMYRALKPGGILGIVQHRGDPKREQDMKAESGYVKQSHVISLAEMAGFKLQASSEINANKKDTRDHPKGVWTLPPVLKDNIDDKKYLAIGESDRMTLKFIKPLNTMAN